MAGSHGKKTQILVDQYNLSGFLDSFSVNRAYDVAETTVYRQDDKSYILGLGDGSANIGGFYDGSAAALDEIIAAALGQDSGQVVTAGVAGLDTLGLRCAMLKAKQTSYEISSPVADAVKVTGQLAADGGVSHGVVIHELKAETAGGNSTGIDNAVATANGGVAHLHCTAFSGLTNIVVKVQDSLDNGTFADIGTFTTLTAVGKQRLVIAAGSTVRRYVRCLWTVSGTGSATFAVGFARR